MIDPERLAAFMLMTAATSIVPGVSMLFVMGQAISGGWRHGTAALLGMQLGYVVWWLLAAAGLGTLALAFPMAFKALALAGALYLGWLGVQSLRHRHTDTLSYEDLPTKTSRRGFRDGALVAFGNPKSLIYIVALLPPFVDPGAAVGPQLVLLAVVATTIDLVVGGLYIGVGQRLAAALQRPGARRRLDQAVGALFVVIAAAIVVDIVYS